jgi:rhodanese-related sulfurtransferase
LRAAIAFQGRRVEYDEVSADEAQALQEAGAVILDVRNHDERAEKRVRGSIHIPLPELQARVGEVPQGRVLTVCKMGARSAAAAQLLEQEGRSDVSSIAGGTDGWEAAGKPIDR